MNFFASNDTKKITLENGIEIDVKKDVSKRTFNMLVDAIPENLDPEKGFTASQALEFSSALFKALVVSWNLDRDPTVENYLELRKDAADAIDEALGNHFSSLTPTDKESRKS